MDTDKLKGVYQLSLELAKAEARRVLGNESGATDERLAATATLLALDERDELDRDAFYFALFVQRVRQLVTTEPTPTNLRTRVLGEIERLGGYFDETGRLVKPWESVVDPETQDIPF